MLGSRDQDAGPSPEASGELLCTVDAFAGLSGEILRAGGSLRFRAHGSSMAPLIRDGDVLLVAPPRHLRIGDVVLCRVGPDRAVVHRVIRRHRRPDGARYTVQGDRVARPDGVLGAAQILGRVAAVERAGVRMALDGPALRLLGVLATLRSRWSLGRGSGCRQAGALVRKVTWLSRYLT